MRNCLILGRKGIIVDDVKNAIEANDIHLMGGTNLEDVKEAFDKQQIHIVIMGAGIDIDDRLSIIRFNFETSNSTTVHMKDWDSGPAGILPFVNVVLNK